MLRFGLCDGIGDIGPIATFLTQCSKPSARSIPKAVEVRIDYSDTHAFTHRIEQEKAAKASGNNSSGNSRITSVVAPSLPSSPLYLCH